MSEPVPDRRLHPHVIRLPVLGVETTFTTDSPAVIRCIREAWGSWEALRDRREVVTPSEAVVSIAVDGTGARARPDEGDPPWWPRPEVPEPTILRIEGPGGAGVADTSRMEARARVSAELVEDHRALVEGWLEPLTLFLLGAADRQPLHAAALVGRPGRQHFPRIEREGAGERPGGGGGREEGRGSTALLLAGPSGVGKSTLTYAAWRHGFGVLADEPTYVQLRTRFRVWGRRARLHLPVGAGAHFPELAGVAPTDLPTGKTKIVVDVGRGGLPFAERAGICLLTRGGGDGPRLEAISVERVVEHLLARLDPGYDLFADTIGERIARVAEGGAWSLTLAGGPEEAIPLLEEAIARAGGSG